METTTIISRNHLNNAVLPFIFWEWYYVLIAFIAVFILETVILKFFINETYARLLKLLFVANIITTIGGYLLQGILRLILGLILYAITEQYFEEHPIIIGILGNVNTVKVTPGITIEVLTAIITSITLSFSLSVIIERKFLLKKVNSSNKNLISKGVITANIVSYLLLTIWLFYGYISTPVFHN